MIYVMSQNHGFNAKFAMVKANKEIWESYHKIALPVVEQVLPNPEWELINLDMDMDMAHILEYLDLECMDLILQLDPTIWDPMEDLDQAMDPVMELILPIIKFIRMIKYWIYKVNLMFLNIQ